METKSRKMKFTDLKDMLNKSKEKFEYDLYYIKHRNPVLDITIIMRTIGAVFGLKGQ